MMQSNQISLFTCLIIWVFFGSEMPSYDKLIPSLLEHGLETLPEHCHLTPGKYTCINQYEVAVLACQASCM